MGLIKLLDKIEDEAINTGASSIVMTFYFEDDQLLKLKKQLDKDFNWEDAATADISLVKDLKENEFAVRMAKTFYLFKQKE